jgi:hypothetical protein
VVNSPPSPAARPQMQFVGFSADAFDGGQGVGTYTQACQASFQPTARMCSSVEILETVSWPAADPGVVGWVRPVLIGDADASGRSNDANGNLSCGGWGFSSNQHVGLGVSGAGSFVTPGFNQGCGDARPIACCAALP